MAKKALNDGDVGGIKIGGSFGRRLAVWTDELGGELQHQPRGARGAFESPSEKRLEQRSLFRDLQVLIPLADADTLREFVLDIRRKVDGAFGLALRITRLSCPEAGVTRWTPEAHFVSLGRLCHGTS